MSFYLFWLLYCYCYAEEYMGDSKVLCVTFLSIANWKNILFLINFFTNSINILNTNLLLITSLVNNNHKYY